MSRETVEIARRWNAAYNDRDFETLLELTDPDFEFRSVFVGVESVFRGHDGLREYFDGIDSAYARFQIPVEQLFDAGAAVLVKCRIEWRGKESGAEGTMPMAVVAWLKAGRVFHLQSYPNLSEGFEAVGLSEPEEQDGARAASPELVDRIKRVYEYWNCGEPDLMVDEYAEDGELDFSRVFTGMPAFRGHDSLRRQIDEFWETWEGVRMDPIEVLDVGGGHFVVDLRLWGKGRRSGVEIDQRAAFLYTARESDGKVVRALLFPTLEEALHFARSESPAPSD
jgi:ketosteroid isomerase-like protein